MTATGAVLCTVGHGTRSLDQLAAVLASAGVERLVDVRRHPGSSRHPHLGRDSLSAHLPGYEWAGDELGGRRRAAPASRHPAWRNASFRAYADHMDTPGFRGALRRLLDQAAQTPTAVMCAETLWWRCHRRLIADAAVLQGAAVVHLVDERHHEPHRLHPAVRADDDGWPCYDVGVQAGLDLQG